MPSASFGSISISRAVYFHRAAEQQLTRQVIIGLPVRPRQWRERLSRPIERIQQGSNGVRPEVRCRHGGETENLARPRA
jgi:hypothetical protein